jgi:hypothetical protein
MSVSGALPTLLCGVAFCMPTLGAEEEAPELAFLEYLGMWEETDEEWLLVDADTMATNEDQSDPVAEGEESAEKQDES